MQFLDKSLAARRRVTPPPSVTPPWPFINQYLLGPAFAEHLPTAWRRVAISDRLKLTAHPELSVTQVRDGDRVLTLIGHMLDPLAPESSNADIVQRLLPLRTRAELLAATAGYGGRWLLIAAIGNESFLFHDALGLRQVFYTDPAQTRDVWVMSQPGIARGVLPLTPDVQALAYSDTQTFRCTFEYRWPGAASPFKELRRLLPNHWLDLGSGRHHRYWPIAPIERIDVDSAVERLLVLLPGLMRAAVARFDVALGVTAGVDSRIVLAAARGAIERVRLMSLRQGRQPDNHPDIEIPARLLGRLGLAHDIVRAPASMSPAFALHFKSNVHQAHDHYGHDAEALVSRYGRTYAAVTGSGAEIARCPFRGKMPYVDPAHLTPETLAWLEYGSLHPFLVAHFADWLRGARQPHVPLLDLFEWEHSYGSWAAMVQLEFDVAWREIFTPYNCRAVLGTMLGVPERYRASRNSQLCHAFIARAWPELLSEPINPHKRAGRLASAWAGARAMNNYWRFRRRLRMAPAAH